MLTRDLRRALAAWALIAASASPAMAEDAALELEQTQTAPDVFIRTMIDELDAAADATDGDAAQRDTQLRASITKHLLVERMNRFVLSRTHRSDAAPDDVAAYDAIFEDYIAAVFSDQLDELVTRRIEIGEVVVRRPDDFIVRSVLYDSDGEARAKIDWRVLEQDGRLGLFDVIAEGISINVERRAQFSALVAKDGFTALLDHMRNVIDADA